MKTTIINYIRAGYPALYLVSPEEQRVEAELKSIAHHLSYHLLFWSTVDGLVGQRIRPQPLILLLDSGFFFMCLRLLFGFERLAIPLYIDQAEIDDVTNLTGGVRAFIQLGLFGSLGFLAAFAFDRAHRYLPECHVDVTWSIFSPQEIWALVVVDKQFKPV